MDQVWICECACRDGLQHESGIVPTSEKIALIDEFTSLGLPRIEVTSFAHPGVLPQFSDAEDVLKAINRKQGVVYKATTINLKAVTRALEAHKAGYGPTEVSLPISASEDHNQANTRRSIEETKNVFRECADILRGSGIEFVGTVAAAYACPFSGPVDPRQVLSLSTFFHEQGVTKVIIGDSSGYAYPSMVRRLTDQLRKELPTVDFIYHFHDNRGVGIANVLVALESGIRYFDSSFGGMGGHPAGIKYAEGLTGNVATEDLMFMLDDLGVETGIDLDRVVPVAHRVEQALGRQLNSKTARSGPPSHRLSTNPQGRPASEHS